MTDPLLDDVEVVALLALLDDRLSRLLVHREHRIEDRLNLFLLINVYVN